MPEKQAGKHCAGENGLETPLNSREPLKKTQRERLPDNDFGATVPPGAHMYIFVAVNKINAQAGSLQVGSTECPNSYHRREQDQWSERTPAGSWTPGLDKRAESKPPSWTTAGQPNSS